MGWGVLLRVRQTRYFLVSLLFFCGVALLLGVTTLTLDMNFARPALKLPYVELVVVLASGSGAILLQPRMWEWERVAAGRVRWLAAGWAVIGCLLPCLTAVVAGTRVPRGVPVAWLLSNALVLSALIVALAPLVSGPVSAALGLLGYMTHGIVNNLWWDTPFLPITRYPEPDTHWVAGVVLVAAAAACHYVTCGATAWSRRTFSRDE